VIFVHVKTIFALSIGERGGEDKEVRQVVDITTAVLAPFHQAGQLKKVHTKNEPYSKR